MKFAWTAYIVPFVFVFAPSLLMIGEVEDILLNTGTAAAGVYLASVAITGYFNRPLGVVGRLFLGLCGFAAVTPVQMTPLGAAVDFTGIVLGAAFLVREFMVGRRAGAAG
jgi:TRAP-type uncharacterized transport system fused permease subunit